MIISQVFKVKQTIVTYTVQELRAMYEKGYMEIRETGKVQVRKIRRYMLDNVTTNEIYLPPLVAYCEEGGLENGKPEQLNIIDGNHRMQALFQLEDVIAQQQNSEEDGEWSKAFKMNRMLSDMRLAVQIFEGLTMEDASQLYIDLNRKGKRVALSKRIAYDSRNLINRMTNEVLTSNLLLRTAGVEQEKNSVMRPKNKNLLSLSQLRQLVGLFIDQTPTSRIGLELEPDIDETMASNLIQIWLNELFLLYPAETIGDYEESMFASFPLLFAVAEYSIDGMKEGSVEERQQIVKTRMRKLRDVEWNRDNPVWRQFEGSERGREQYYYLNNTKKNKVALVEWLKRQGGE